MLVLGSSHLVAVLRGERLQSSATNPHGPVSDRIVLAEHPDRFISARAMAGHPPGSWIQPLARPILSGVAGASTEKDPAAFPGSQAITKVLTPRKTSWLLTYDSTELRCRVCDFESSRKKDVARHEATHQKEIRGRWECQACGKDYTRKDNLQRHLKACRAAH
jgi:hypothetical protein